MQRLPTKFPEVIRLKPQVFRDPRGYFFEPYNEARHHSLGVTSKFVMDGESLSSKGTVRGLHFREPGEEKLVRCIRGAIWDVVVDIRPQSPTYGQSLGLELNDRNGHLLWAPPGFAHGFCVIGSEPADVLYKVDSAYEPSTEGGIVWSDPELAIQLPVSDPIVSDKDRLLPTFERYRTAPPAWDRP